MHRLLCLLIAFIFCFLFAGPTQAYACFMEYNTLFFDDVLKSPPDADVIAEVFLTDINDKSLSEKAIATANVVRVIKTSDARVRQGEKIALKYRFTSCGPQHENGSQGIIIAKIGADIEDRLVLCLYQRQSAGRIVSPIESPRVAVRECVPSEVEAAKRIKLAAEKGEAKAQTALGLMYEKGQIVRMDNAEALKWFLLAAESGAAEAQYELGNKYWRDQNYAEAEKWYRLAAEKGNEPAKTGLESLQKMKNFIRAAENGDAESQYTLGKRYFLRMHAAEAMKWFKLAAAQGQTEAMYQLGRMYEYDERFNRDHAEAEKWYRLATEKGNIFAESPLRDLQFIKTLTRAAENGDAEQQLKLGYIYSNRNNGTEAAKWFKLAAAQGRAEAMFELGMMYEYGYSVTRDYTEAEKWYRLAEENGDIRAKIALEALPKQR